MDFNPYEQAPFGGRLSGYARDVRIHPDSILPPKDNNMPGFLRLGWFFLSRAAWPEKGYFNVMFIYGVMRRRRHGLDLVLHLAPWLLLTLAEVGAVYLQSRGAASAQFAWFGLLMGESITLPPVLGLYLVIFLLHRLQVGVERLTLEELVCAPIKGGEVVYALLALPMSTQCMALLANTLVLLLVYLHTIIYEAIVQGTTPEISAVGIVFLLGIRFYLLRALSSHAAACAVRAVLMVREPAGRFVRALRDYLFPYAAWLLILPLVNATLLLFSPGAACLSMIVTPLGIALAASMAELEAGNILVWLGKLHHHWAPIREDETPWVPSRLWEKWSSRDPDKPLRSRMLR